MVTELIIVWVIGVVLFFALWAVLVKIVHRISERKGERQDTADEATEAPNDQQQLEKNP
ncbi:MAG: hypothetical protein IJ622_00095 [Bacteroidales bacterium]|nr:hypothetical protein [Bacteroidales bacterium]